MISGKYFRILFLGILIFASGLLRAQERGTKFVSGLSWSEIQEKARVEHKLIFVDCYATWCGPCRYMDKNIFPLVDVGEYMNEHFVNVRMQMDKTPSDLPEITQCYATADSLHKKFKIGEYPTYLVFSSDGQAIHKMTGSATNGGEFLVRVKAALNPEMQCFTLIRNWHSHEGDSSYLFKTLAAAISTESDSSTEIQNVYIGLLRNPWIKENIELFSKLLHSSKDDLFRLYLSNRSHIDRVMGINYVEDMLCRIVFQEETMGLFENKNVPVYWGGIMDSLKGHYPELKDQLVKSCEPIFQYRIGQEIKEYVNKKDTINRSDWRYIYKKMLLRYPNYDFGLVFLNCKLGYYARKGIALERSKTALTMLNTYGYKLNDLNINNLVWYHIFNITSDEKILNKSLKWMRISIERTSNEDDYDTYANLLYKTGNLNDAIIWEKNAIDLAIKNQTRVDGFKSNLEKMNKRQRTWNDNSPVPGKTIL